MDQAVLLKPWAVALCDHLDLEVSVIDGEVTATLLHAGGEIATWELPKRNLMIRMGEPHEYALLLFGSDDLTLAVSIDVAVRIARRFNLTVQRFPQ